MSDDRGLKDKVIIITGGGGDIGGATARKLAGFGARVIIFDLLDEEAGKARAAELGAAEYRRADQGEEAQVQAGVADVVKRFGRLDAAIANAALGTTGNLLEQTLEDWRTCFRVNLFGCVLVAQAAVKQMLDQSPDGGGIRGKVLFTSSWVGAHPYPGSVNYNASKAAVDHTMRLIAQNYAAQGIRANAVAPGILDAGLAGKLAGRRPELREKFLAAVPVGELGTAEQIADAYVFLCSRESNYMTGQVLYVDGGASLTRRE